MKTYGDLKDMSEDQIWDHVINEWTAPGNSDKKYTMLLAYEFAESYEADGFYLMREKETGDLYEVNGSHCSCYGFENQWKPSRTVVGALEVRGGFCFSNEDLKAAVAEVIA